MTLVRILVKSYNPIIPWSSMLEVSLRVHFQLQWNRARHEPLSYKVFHLNHLNKIINFLQDYLNLIGMALVNATYVLLIAGYIHDNLTSL